MFTGRRARVRTRVHPRCFLSFIHTTAAVMNHNQPEATVHARQCRVSFTRSATDIVSLWDGSYADAVYRMGISKLSLPTANKISSGDPKTWNTIVWLPCSVTSLYIGILFSSYRRAVVYMVDYE